LQANAGVEWVTDAVVDRAGLTGDTAGVLTHNQRAAVTHDTTFDIVAWIGHRSAVANGRTRSGHFVTVEIDGA